MKVIHADGGFEYWMQDYWLGHCEGFRVEDASRRLGFVEEVVGDEDAPESLLVRGGLFANRGPWLDRAHPAAACSGARQVSTVREGIDTARIAALEPTAHVQEGPDEYRVDVDAPGLEAGDFKVRLVGRLLHVTGRDLRGLRPDSSFEFAFRLPDLVTGDEVTAAFVDGRLVVRSPVRPAEARVVEITAP